MFDLIKKNINLRSGIILLSLTIFFVFITNSFKKNKSKDISNFVVKVEKGILSDSINTSGEVKAIRTSNIGPNIACSDCLYFCLLYTSPSPRDATLSRMPSSA